MLLDLLDLFLLTDKPISTKALCYSSKLITRDSNLKMHFTSWSFLKSTSTNNSNPPHTYANTLLTDFTRKPSNYILTILLLLFIRYLSYINHTKQYRRRFSHICSIQVKTSLLLCAYPLYVNNMLVFTKPSLVEYTERHKLALTRTEVSVIT